MSKEVESGTDATISCVITGITQQLDIVVWTKGETNVNTLSETDYIVSDGEYGSNSQTTTLTVKAAANTADSSYTCVVTSNEWDITNRESDVTLNTFCKSISFNFNLWFNLSSQQASWFLCHPNANSNPNFSC